jgi:PilZ domain-containing protein
MNFAQSKFNEAIELLQSQGSSRDRSDKRLAARTKFSMPLHVRSMDQNTLGPPIAAEMRDLSARGISLFIKHAVEEGSNIVLELPQSGDQKTPFSLICRVIYCRSQGNGVHLVGGEFTGTLNQNSSEGDDAAREAERIQRSILD